MSELALDLMRIVISICVTLVTLYVVPFLYQLKEDRRYKGLFDIVDVAVKAAEQTITGSGKGQQKKAEVVAFVSRWLNEHSVSITAEQLSYLIESAVYAMKQAQE